MSIPTVPYGASNDAVDRAPVDVRIEHASGSTSRALRAVAAIHV